MADPPHSPFDARVDAVMRVINDHADRTGKKVMYAFNVSDELDAMHPSLRQGHRRRRDCGHGQPEQRRAVVG